MKAGEKDFTNKERNRLKRLSPNQGDCNKFL